MQQRYFIGLTLPDALSNEMELIRHDLLQGKQIMEPLVPHITLLHPNILMKVSPIYIRPRLSELAADILPIHITLTRVDMFDKRVLYVAVDSPDLIELQKRAVALLPDDIRASYAIGRDFTPHVTIAQAKPMQKLDDTLISELSDKITPLLPARFTADKLSTFVWVKPRVYKVDAIG